MSFWKWRVCAMISNNRIEIVMPTTNWPIIHFIGGGVVGTKVANYKPFLYHFPKYISKKYLEGILFSRCVYVML